MVREFDEFEGSEGFKGSKGSEESKGGAADLNPGGVSWGRLQGQLRLTIGNGNILLLLLLKPPSLLRQVCS